jgi:hypothetical protein
MEATNSSLDFHYIPLETPKSIRLLKFYNGPDPYKIACSISHFVLDDRRQQYVALSYVWGAAPNKVDITVNGSRLSIPKSAWETLFYLRLALINQNLPIDTLPFWIDSICINQASQEEKITQIPLMEDIFSQAYMVIGNLTTESPTVNRQLLVLLFTWKDQEYSWEMVRARFEFYGMYQNEKDFLQQVKEVLKRFSDHPWFSRVWILQEFVLSQKLTFMITDKLSQHNAVILNFGMLLTDFFRSPDRGVESRGLHVGSDVGIWVMTQLSSRRGDTTFPLHFSTIVTAASRLQATGKHDEIYGCLGLAERSLRDHFSIDYQEPFPMLCRRLTSKLILHEESVEILYQSNFLAGRPNDVSWAFNADPGTHPRRYEFETVHLPQLRYVNKKYMASNGRKQCYAHVQDNVLTVEGYVVDTIGGISDMFPHKMSEDSDMRVYRQIQGRFVYSYLTLGYSFTYEEWKSVLVGDDLGFPLGRGELLGPGLPIPDVTTTFEAYVWGKTNSVNPMTLIYTDEILALEYLKSMMAKLERQRLCFASKYGLGFVPGDAEVGDHIAILLGGGFPFVLRKAGDSFRLVGRCYLHRMMKGQAVPRDKKPEKIQLV